MDIAFPYGTDTILLSVPEDTILYTTSYPQAKSEDISSPVMDAIHSPISSEPLGRLLSRKKEGPVVVVISDITRPIPYTSFIKHLLNYIESAGIAKKDIRILIATGMHRASTHAEKVEMLGSSIVSSYAIYDHNCEDETQLTTLPGTSCSGKKVRINSLYAHAGFRMTIGLVEPHFMAGFSGGRKSICPGICSLDTVQAFHGWDMLADAHAANGIIDNNPCHMEALSVARKAGVDFSLQVILNTQKKIVQCYAGDMEESHNRACAYVRSHACPQVSKKADIVCTSGGGYPLDATFYQSVKGIVNGLPAVKKHGNIVIAAGCSSGIGSPEYAGIMQNYGNRWEQFITDFSAGGRFIKDQWQFQMHIRALQKTGSSGITYITDGIPHNKHNNLAVDIRHVKGKREAETIYNRITTHAAALNKRIALIPEGPYCSPMHG